MFLLQHYSRRLGSAAQLYIYDKKHNLPHARELMLTTCLLSCRVERKLFDDNEPVYDFNNRFIKLNSRGDSYIVKQSLSACLKANQITTELSYFHQYEHSHRLSRAGEEALIEFIKVDAKMTPQAVVDELENALKNYISVYGELHPQVELMLIKTGHHHAIMHYLTHSKYVIRDRRAVQELLARANREEVVTYFNMYARLTTN